jgi:6-phospho-beta-glucosidase
LPADGRYVAAARKIMKIAVIGGAGVRTPLLVHGLCNSDLPIHELSLYDTDQDKLELIEPLVRQLAGSIQLQACTTVSSCVDGADFVFVSIRVGGIEGRARDEAAILRRGIVGQETIGPGGFAMAMRTIPHMVEYAAEISRRAPRAWIVNFTNPVGIITQAVAAQTGARIIGICDTPAELFHDLARVIGLPLTECYFDYFGLNHLGWVREVYCDGKPQIGQIWRTPERLKAVYRHNLFEVDFLRELRLFPTEYLYYYYRPEVAAKNLRQAGTTRGAAIEKLNAGLFADLARPGIDRLRAYADYLTARNASYMQLETGEPAAAPVSPWASPTGYDKIAMSVVHAIHFNSGSIIPLNVLNGGNLSCLEASDIVEVPCVVNANGALPLHVGSVPEAVLDLIVRVKEYERATIRAAISGDRGQARDALSLNPLVADAAVAASLLSDLGMP